MQSVSDKNSSPRKALEINDKVPGMELLEAVMHLHELLFTTEGLWLLHTTE